MREQTPLQSVVRMRRHWLNVALALAIALTCAVSTVFAAVTIPPVAGGEYSKTLLAPGSQETVPGVSGVVGWSNVIPNALAGYYTYEPYTNADAVALGFPASCGNAKTGLTADLNSTDDCYTITVKRFTQPLSLAPILGAAWGTNGLKDQFGNYFGVANYTDVYGYGSGGALWTPPQFFYDTANANKITKKTTGLATVTGNAPGAFSGFQFDTDKGIWHFPAPSIKGKKGRPVRVQWLNQLPNVEIPGFDPTVDCSANAPDCFPYNRIVTHVHGAHVGPESDGLAHAGFNPDFSNLGTKFNLSVLPGSAGPPGTYVYPMDQEAATIWYHDHAVGTTHLNTNQGMAGFFPISDDNEKCLQTTGTVSSDLVLPGTFVNYNCTKYLPTGTVADPTAYELGFALQDRVFDANGQFAMPDAPVVDANFPTCDTTDAGTRMATCSPLFMRVAHAADANSLTPAGSHLIPYNEATITDTGVGGINENAPFVGTSATLEYFGNMPVVNGVVYGKYDVEPRVYRMRFIGGTDSRTWVLRLENRAAPGVPIPFYQIGSEQGFLNTPVPRTEMLLLPGERLDVLVNFAGIAPGSKIVLANLGPDAPYQGEPINLIARSVDIPEIMEFTVAAFDVNTADVPNPASIPSLRPIGGGIVSLTATANLPVRKVALEEIVDEYGRIMPTIDRRGYDLPGMPATEIIHLNDVEVWDIINTTADAHPMHLHLVAFQVLHRQAFDTLTFVPAVNDITNNVFAQPSYTPLPSPVGNPVLPDKHDAGWKDTVYSPPGFVTRVIAHFDKAGEYVWHCHILSHEEHDMMRPMKVVSLIASRPESVSVSYTAGLSATVTVVDPVNSGLPLNTAKKYVVEYKLATDSNWSTHVPLGPGTVSNSIQTVTFPDYGLYNIRVKISDPAVSPTFADSPYLNSVDVMVSPVDGITPASGVLGGTTQQFTLSSTVNDHVLWIGTSKGSSNLGRYTVAAGSVNNIVTVTGLPTTTVPVFVRLFIKGTKPDAVNPARLLTVWSYNDYSYTSASGTPAPASIVSPVSLSVVGGSQQFVWTNSGADFYQVAVGTTGPGSIDVGLFPASPTTATSTTATGLPTNGSKLYVRIYSQIGASWFANDYTYTSASPATMTSPVSPATIGASQTFSWTNSGADAYQVAVGTTGPGAIDIGLFPGTPTTATSTTVTGLPTNGSTVYVRIYSQIGANWYASDYTYSAASPAVMLTPVSPSLVGLSQTIIWNNSGADVYQVAVGTTGPGSIDIGLFPSAPTTSTSTSITGLPSNGSTVYVRIYSKIGSIWYARDYQYISN